MIAAVALADPHAADTSSSMRRAVTVSSSGSPRGLSSRSIVSGASGRSLTLGRGKRRAEPTRRMFRASAHPAPRRSSSRPAGADIRVQRTYRPSSFAASKVSMRVRSAPAGIKASGIYCGPAALHQLRAASRPWMAETTRLLLGKLVPESTASTHALVVATAAKFECKRIMRVSCRDCADT